MAFDAFLKLEGIPGESRDEQYKEWIEVESFSWGVAQVTTGGGAASATGGAGAGKAAFQDLHFVTNFSKASPELFTRCATGEHIKTGVLAVRKAGEKPLDFYKLRLTDVLVSSYQDGGAGFDVPVDQISLNFASVAIELAGQ